VGGLPIILGIYGGIFPEIYGGYDTVDNYPPTQWNIPVITEEQILAEYEKRVKESPALVYDEAKEYLRSTLEINIELEVSQAWFKQLKDKSTIAVLDKRVLGRKAFAEEKYDDAIKLYLKAMKLEPKDPYIDVSIAKAYAKLGDAKNMQKYFDSAVEKDGNNSFIHMAKAKILLESADEAGAAEEIVKAVAVVDKTNLALLERIEELALQLNMEDEANQLDKMIRAIMMPESLSTQP
jgi:tetratricopeptide (TPR) repeat protein